MNSSMASLAAMMRAALRWERPDRLVRAAMTGSAIGPTFAGALAASVARYPNAPAVIDAGSTWTYGQLWHRAQAVARELRWRDIGERSTVGLMAENSIDFVASVAAVSIVGADLVLMNTGFAGPQLADVTEREACDLLVVTGRFADLAADHSAVASMSLADDAAWTRGPSVVPSRRLARAVILTSGTTGTPKGARRAGGSVLTAAGFLQRVPVRSGDRVVLACPMFHAWAFTHLALAIAFASTIIIDADLAPGDVAGLVDTHDADGLVVVPAVLQRILAAGGSTDRLRYIASSGSALPTAVVDACLERFGPVLYNIYGSTEVALATIAEPADLATAPATAGRRVPGVRVELLDDQMTPVADGATGRIFVDSGSAFDGYTGGGDKERLGRLVATGDVGHFEGPLLFVDGRSDDMIVSGGENVFPGEVEDVIADLPGVVEAAVVGVADEEFGQRLAAYVVADDVSADAVRDAVRSRLARYKVPRDVHFVDELPRTTTGKIRRSDLTPS